MDYQNDNHPFDDMFVRTFDKWKECSRTVHYTDCDERIKAKLYTEKVICNLMEEVRDYVGNMFNTNRED